MNEVVVVVLVTLLCVTCGLFSGLYFASQKILLTTRVQYRTENIQRESAERQLTVVQQQLADTQGLLDQHRELVRHLMDRRFQLECDLERAQRGGGRLALDDQTKALVRLATSNPNEHEKHAAAMLVCKRLREKLDN
jgi:TolA-binding protein